jgi:hypothetical protein
LKRSRIPRKKKKKASLSFLSPWTASALNGGVKGSTAWRIGFKNGMYEYYSYIRRRQSVVPGCLSRTPRMALFAFSFCSFEEEGNETNQKKREVSKSSLINLTSLCHIFEYSLHLSRLVLPVACHGEQVLVHKGWDFCLYFLCHLESGWPWRGSGVAEGACMHHVLCCATPLAGMDRCMQCIACSLCKQVLGAVQRFERRLRAAWEAGVCATYVV